MSGKGGGKAAGGAGKAVGKKMRTSARIGLTFPVGRIRRVIKSKIGKMRLQKSAPVFMAAVLEYIAVEILELSGNALIASQTRAHKSNRLTNVHVPLAIYNDVELSSAFRDFVFEGGPPPLEAREILARLMLAEKEKKKKRKKKPAAA
jgi:histone H2A